VPTRTICGIEYLVANFYERRKMVVGKGEKKETKLRNV
jgi:hypothetical protein